MLGAGLTSAPVNEGRICVTLFVVIETNDFIDALKVNLCI
jgi:hypothetical protein